MVRYEVNPSDLQDYNTRNKDLEKFLLHMHTARPHSMLKLLGPQSLLLLETSSPTAHGSVRMRRDAILACYLQVCFSARFEQL